MQDLAGHVGISAFVMRWVLLDGFKRKVKGLDLYLKESSLLLC